jgi:hypothetical protein
MKTKVIATILGVVFCAALLCATDASAELGWYNCTVNYAGPGGDTIYIKLGDTANTPAFVNKWFVANENMQNQMLAVALTAMTNNQTVRVRVDPTIRYPTIYAMYLED